MAKRSISSRVAAGDRFGRWVVLSTGGVDVYDGRQRQRWLCRCACGVEREVAEQSLTSGRTRSCGCLQRETSSARHSTHGENKGGRRSTEANTWHGMLSRCYNPNDKRFKDYGGRGIEVCDRWRISLAAFLEDMGRRPSPRHSLDRRNNDGPYSPDNCRWAIPHQQMTNRRCTRVVRYRNADVPLATLAKRFDIPANTLRARILSGWSVDEAVSLPVRPKAPNGSGRRR